MATPPGVGKRGKFFLLAAAALLLFVLVGFSRTLYLRPWFPAEPLPLYLYVHGVVLTLWFVFLLAQTVLVARGKLTTHRRAGVFGAGLAVLVVVLALAAVLGIVDRFRSLGIDVEAARGQISFIVWSDLGALAAFVVFVWRGVLKRKVADAHKRLMLLGSISIMAPAFIRVADIPPFDLLGGVLFTLGALLLAAGSLLVYDLVSLRRVHRETLWGIPFFFIMLLGAAFLIPGTALDDWLLAWMW